MFSLFLFFEKRRPGAGIPRPQLHRWACEWRIPGAQFWTSRSVLLLPGARAGRRRLYYIRAARVQTALCCSERGAAAAVLTITG